MRSRTLADILHFCYLPANHTHSQSHTHTQPGTHTHRAAPLKPTNTKRSPPSYVSVCVQARMRVQRGSVHTSAHTHSLTHTHAGTAAACESKEQKKERARIRWMLLLATSRRAVASFRMWLCLWIDDASDERPLVAADTGDEQQQVGGAGAVLCCAIDHIVHCCSHKDHGSVTLWSESSCNLLCISCVIPISICICSIAKYSYRCLCGFHLRLKRKKYHTQ